MDTLLGMASKAKESIDLSYEDVRKWFHKANLIDGKIMTEKKLKLLYDKFKTDKIDMDKMSEFVKKTAEETKMDANVMMAKLKEVRPDFGEVLDAAGLSGVVDDAKNLTSKVMDQFLKLE